MSDVFALCLSGMHTASQNRGISSWDIGEIDHRKYSGGSVHVRFSHVSGSFSQFFSQSCRLMFGVKWYQWYTVPLELHDNLGELDPQTGQRSRPNS